MSGFTGMRDPVRILLDRAGEVVHADRGMIGKWHIVHEDMYGPARYFELKAYVRPHKSAPDSVTYTAVFYRESTKRRWLMHVKSMEATSI